MKRAVTFGMGSCLLAVLVGAIVMVSSRPVGRKASRPPVVGQTEGRTLLIDLPAEWIQVPGQLSTSFRSSRPGAGFFQMSLHPPLVGKVDGARAEKELDSMLREMESEMEFGQRLKIGHLSAKAGSLAYATYRSPSNGILGFWLLPGDSLVFATYVDGGTAASEIDIREAQEALVSSRFE